MTAEVREKLISEHGVPELRSVYRAVCDDCSWISDDWAQVKLATGQARFHNRDVHRDTSIVALRINERKASTMRDKRTVDTAIEVAEARLAALLDERARLDKLPKEPAENGTVVRFPIQYDPHGPTYDYAAIRANSKWWVTGKEAGARSWDQLLDFVAQDWRIAGGERRLRMSVFYTGTGDVLRAAE